MFSDLEGKVVIITGAGSDKKKKSSFKLSL